LTPPAPAGVQSLPHRDDIDIRLEVPAIDRRRFQAAREIFIDALALEPGAREAFVHEACGDDPLLCDETLNLLACHCDGDDLNDAIDASARPVTVPAAIGPYDVLDLLGQGGMGVVYRARRRDNNPDAGPAPVVALKVLRAGVLSEQLKRRFQREIEVLRRLDHPGIARLLDAGTADGAPYLATEYVEGLTLGRWREEVNAPLADRVRVLADLCDAVHAAHRHGVVHRDLKPDNVLVTADGRPKVLDFGIARLQDDGAPRATLATQTWQLLGTIRYMSPEQATGGTAAIDARTDIYTLGVIAFELLTGSLPYNLARLSTPRALLEITTADPRPLGVRDGALDLIVQHALAKDPNRRYASAAVMADDLRRHLAGRPLSLRRPGPVARLRRSLRARPGLRRMAMVLAIAAAAAGITLAVTLTQPSKTPTWAVFYDRLEEADRLRHNGAQNRANWEAAIAQFQQARTDLSQLPGTVYTGDLNRYVKWRLGELHYFIGSLEHDAVLLEEARGYWRDATLVAWTPGSANAIDRNVSMRVNVLHLGAHHAESGVGMAHVDLATLRSPMSNLTLAFEMHDRAANTLGDGSRAYHDGIVQPAVRPRRHRPACGPAGEPRLRAVEPGRRLDGARRDDRQPHRDRPRPGRAARRRRPGRSARRRRPVDAGRSPGRRAPAARRTAAGRFGRRQPRQRASIPGPRRRPAQRHRGPRLLAPSSSAGGPVGAPGHIDGQRRGANPVPAASRR